MKVYIAGPYTKGDVRQNVRRAIIAAGRLRNEGFTPFVPHLSHFWHWVSPRSYEDWLEMGLEWLECCDVVLRLDGESEGADREVWRAEELGKPVFHTVGDVLSQEYA